MEALTAADAGAEGEGVGDRSFNETPSRIDCSKWFASMEADAYALTVWERGYNI